MDARAATAATKVPVVALGGGFMRSREARDFGARVGLDGWGPYFRGRCGVLGEADADVVAAAATFFPPGLVRASWDGRGALGAADAARGYAEACQAWGRRRLAGFDPARRLTELLEAVVNRADVAGAPLFAGWRALPLPDDPPARVAQLAHVLRELRGAMHAVAVLAGGLTPLQAILASRPEDARFFGWPEPYPDVDDEVRRRRARAEELTDELVAPAYAALGDGEAQELVDLLDHAHRTAFPPA
ncbi:MAG: hypothetical protein GEV03_15095 [Streptosporangiales bacterium]|nr:hypothetical protein [Streptosporangiales bacterium]